MSNTVCYGVCQNWHFTKVYTPGPVVRVTPDEVHVLEPAAYHKIFVSASVRKTDAYRRFSNGTGFEGDSIYFECHDSHQANKARLDMTAISASHDAHRRLRAPLDKLFARGSIIRIEQRVISRVERMCERLRGHKDAGEVVNLTNALSSLTTDIISSIIFDEPSDYLGDPDFNNKWYNTLKQGTRSVPLFKHMPWMVG